MEHNEKRIVMTLDAGGTNLVFSAIQDGLVIAGPVALPSVVDDLHDCLQTIVEGFSRIKSMLPEEPVAISFAFPGPADYQAGVIGDLPNFPAFRGGVALGAFLEEHFGIPVYINNDGNLFAYGEAIAGILPEVNRRLKEAGNEKVYRNLLGFTWGTGFGAGVVTDGKLLLGDNGAGGDVWCFRNPKYPDYIAEESVSIRAVKRVYAKLSGDASDLTPKEIYEIAEEKCSGCREAAISAFEELGEVAGEVIASAVTLIDGIVVIGGGLSGGAKYIFPALMKALRAEMKMTDGSHFGRLQMTPFNLEEADEWEAFLCKKEEKVAIPGTTRWAAYDLFKRVGIALSRQGTERSVMLGAYHFALSQLDKR